MLKIINPATEKVITEIEEDSSSSVAEKFKRAKAAQKKWALTPFAQKKAAITKFRGMLVDRKEKLAQILTSEVGKPIAQSRNELGGVLGRIDFFLSESEKVCGSVNVLKDASQKLEETISHEPLGVIANISAWNYPYLVGSNVVIPALLTGNTVLYKPSEFSTLTGLEIVSMLHEAGIPKDVCIAVIGTGNVGAALLDQPLNGVFFTGSYATGKKIAESAAKKLIKTQLELGGKDPIYVADDVDVQNAAEAVGDGAFYNAGQSCCSVERIYVHEKIYDSFIESFMNFSKSMKVGDPLKDDTYIGPLTRKVHLDFLEKQVSDATSKGAKVLMGGKRTNGVFFEPTVLVNVNHTMSVMKDESFGPIIGIQKVKSDEEALELMNDCEYGLTAGVYTQNRARAEKILSQVNSGSAYWNCCDRVSPRLPWSGRGHSGLGSTLSTYGILTFLQPKAWHLKG